MATGKLLQSRDEQLICQVSYQFQQESDHSFWGELTPVDYVHIDDGGGYLLELEDGRRCKCSLRKRVNRAVTSLPPHYVYHFTGSGKFE
ncbi:MAG: hypothetical protein A2Z29_03405 [Chloroflexi bacterium RBG_16_56_11]|nr:MAG: hypothetical protein A2Z29_03405 [Chloroflexi bacterium RBG_16_56_11]